MKKFIYIILILVCAYRVKAQETKQDTVKQLEEVVITANRTPIKIKNNPGALSLISRGELEFMPKSVAADEALSLVPGVRVENPHDGERVHISIRGQGILTEKGLRGIGVMLDGIPLNDPSGFAPDLFDVDWENVKRIEVIRGPAASMYGSGAAAGVINIVTNDGTEKPLGVKISQHFGSYGFHKTLLNLGGTSGSVNYNINISRLGGNGFRDHQAFWGNNLYEKLNFTPSEKLKLTQIISHTDYFHQNPEGLNLSQLNNPKQANPDANPFNEYQKTNRTTWGLTGNYKINDFQSIKAYAYYRSWVYKETSNKYAEYRNYTEPGSGLQYNISLKQNNIVHHFGFGSDLKFQNINLYKLQSAPNPNREESTDETNIETDSLLANNLINQYSTGVYAFYRFELGKFNLIANIRQDNIYNKLTNKMLGLDTAVTDMNFIHTTFRTGLSYNLSDEITMFANYSQGFLPPSVEELASNPVGYSGFNTHLKPAVSECYETGTRGTLFGKIYYDITGFLMYTTNDFFRFKQTGRGNQEVFYGNAGNSRRYGLETYFSVNILHNLNFQAAYTYSDFRYVSAQIDPVYTDTNYVLTKPPQSGQYLPNCPKHQLYTELKYKLNKNFKFGVSTVYQSEWTIYTDPDAYYGRLDPAVYQNRQKGYMLFNTKVAYNWQVQKVTGELSLSVRNITDAKYIAFTEPDPDGNSYQPGPGREFFVNLIVRF